MGKTRCVVPGCGVLTNKYKFPSYDVKVREEWLKRCGAHNILVQDKVCPRHFDVPCIITTNGRIRKYSVPSLFLEYVQTGGEEDNFMFPVREDPSNENLKIISVPEAWKADFRIRSRDHFRSSSITKVLSPIKTYSRKRRLDLNNHKTSSSATEICLLQRPLMDVDLGHETSQPLTANTSKKLNNNNMENYMEPRTTCQKIPALDGSVESCTTYSSKDQMQQPKMSENCKPLLEVIFKEEKPDEIFPCHCCLDVFSTSQDLNFHVNNQHLKIEINDELITEKIKQENDVEDDIHMNDEHIQILIKNEFIMDKIKNEKTQQIEDDIS